MLLGMIGNFVGICSSRLTGYTPTHLAVPLQASVGTLMSEQADVDMHFRLCMTYSVLNEIDSRFIYNNKL